MIESIFTGLTTIVEKTGTMVSGMLTGVGALFYTAPVAPETVGTLTLVGNLALIGLGVGMFWFGFKMVKGFITMRG
jgi:hypothetical protein